MLSKDVCKHCTELTRTDGWTHLEEHRWQNKREAPCGFYDAFGTKTSGVLIDAEVNPSCPYRFEHLVAESMEEKARV